MAARIPQIGRYPGHPLLPTLLPPPPPPLTLPPPPPPPPPPPSSSTCESRSKPAYDPYRSQHHLAPMRPGPYPFSHVSHQTRGPGFRGRTPENTIPMPSGGYKRPLLSSSTIPIKKVKNESSSLSQEMSMEIEMPTADQPNKPSGGSDANSTSKRGNLMQNLKNPSLPKELIKLFGPLKCDLCCVSVNSTVQAKMHYIGKQHEKKVNAFLSNWCKETGQPMPTVKMGPSSQKKCSIPEDSFCKVCNLALTSVQHAQQHYMGRNHLRVLNGHTPLKPGYFNKETGKWQRIPHAENDPTGRFGIGSGFLPPSTDPLGLLDLEPSTSSATSVSEEMSGKSQSINRRFFCELCQVATTSQDQLDMHLKGAKHRKAEKLAASVKSSQVTTPAPTTPSDSILASVIRINTLDKNKVGVKDYSIYRTPSGQFYCQPCNLTLNSESQFSQHCESKKHKLALLKKPGSRGTGRGLLTTK